MIFYNGGMSDHHKNNCKTWVMYKILHKYPKSFWFSLYSDIFGPIHISHKLTSNSLACIMMLPFNTVNNNTSSLYSLFIVIPGPPLYSAPIVYHDQSRIIVHTHELYASQPLYGEYTVLPTYGNIYALCYHMYNLCVLYRNKCYWLVSPFYCENDHNVSKLERSRQLF